MSSTLVMAALLTAALAAAHSYLGERYIIAPLIRGGRLPRLRFGDAFTAGTVRGAWHITSIAWWGLAAVLLRMAFAGHADAGMAAPIAVTFGIAALTSMGARL